MMKDVQILPLIVDLVGTFFRSSHAALNRSCLAHGTNTLHEPTGLNIFTHKRPETQAALESIVFSFLTVEATINYIFFNEQQRSSPDGLDRWLRQKWRRQLSVYDRFALLIMQYSTAKLDNFQALTTLFSEFISFRNRIVHAHPEQYDALIERVDGNDDDVAIHDVEFSAVPAKFPASGLAEEIGRIGSEDARRAFEIMLLVVCFLDEQFIAEMTFGWRFSETDERVVRPKAILASMTSRDYPDVLPDSFAPDVVTRFPEVLARMERAQQTGACGGIPAPPAP
jgi:hypothetical protein